MSWSEYCPIAGILIVTILGLEAWISARRKRKHIKKLLEFYDRRNS